jgi:hypothetical protein
MQTQLILLSLFVKRPTFPRFGDCNTTPPASAFGSSLHPSTRLCDFIRQGGALGIDGMKKVGEWVWLGMG